MKHTLLLVDDDEVLAKQVAGFLEQSGYELSIALDGKQALEKVQQTKFDLLLLDWMLPEISGIDVCKEIRKTSTVPIIMVTARGEETDKIIGLELGADDYMTKPYSLKELLARIRSLLRRSSELQQNENTLTADIVRRFPHFEIHESSHELIVGGLNVEITRSEFDLVGLFCSQPGHVFTRNDLLSHITGKEHGAFDRSVDMHISNIRKKIEPDPKRPIYFKTVWGVGYRFEIPR